MPRETRSGTPPPAGSRYAATGSRSSVNGIFRKDGEYWTLGYGGKAFRLKDTKGFAYLAHLLRHPGTEFHVFDLVGGIAGGGDDEAQKHARQAGSASDRARQSVAKTIKSVLGRIAQS